MSGKPEIDNLNDALETRARQQMNLDDTWRLESMASAINVGLEECIDELANNFELDDDQRWTELAERDEILAWLPKGLLLVTMTKKEQAKTERKAAFINT